MSRQALQLYDLYLKKPQKICPDLCKFLEITIRTQVVLNKSQTHGNYVKISMKNTIKVTQSKFLYDGLTLMAEIGGYVGLFLGISVVHINEMLHKVWKSFMLTSSSIRNS